MGQTATDLWPRDHHYYLLGWLHDSLEGGTDVMQMERRRSQNALDDYSG